MTLKSFQAFMLHKRWSGETSARVTLFSQEFGVLEGLCKGGRAAKKQALLQPFLPLWVSVKEQYGRYYVQALESTAPSFCFQGNALFSGLYVNELLYHVLKQGVSEPELFQAYVVTLEGVASSTDNFTLQSSLRRFEWAVLKACGHSFTWTTEAGTAALIDPQKKYQFRGGEGFIQATQGISGEHLLALAADDLSSATYLKTAKIIMREAIAHLLCGKVLRARELYLASS